MADTNTKITYVSLENLNYYDDKIKDYIQTRDEALQVNIDSANTAISNEETRAKAAEATNAKAAQDAQDSVNSLAAKVGTVPEDTTVMEIITNIQENAYDDTELRGLITGLESNKADKTQVATDIADAVKAETDARVEAVAGVQSAVDTLTSTVASNKSAIESTVSTLEQKVDANESDIEGKMTSLAEKVTANETAVKTTLPNAINDEKAAREAADAELAADIKTISDDYLKKADKDELDGKITANTNALSTLNGDGEGSVKKAIDDAINKFATDVTNDNVVNSYKELIDWAAEHGGEAAEMVEAIEANTTAIGELETFIGSLPEGATVSTVVAYIEKLVADEKARAEQAEGGLSERLDAVEAMLGDGDGSVADQIEEAKQAAIDSAVATAAADATEKANTAETNAKNYADGLNATMDGRVSALETASATHALKSEVETVAGRVTTVEGKVSTLETEMDAVEALAAANKAAHEANEAAIALKASQADLNAEISAREAGDANLQAQIDAFEECTTNDIDGLFA